MTPYEAEELFWELADTVTALDESGADTPDLEPTLLKLLYLVKNHPEHAELFMHLFINIGTTTKHSSWIVLYCMRDLRWPEVRTAIFEWFSALGGRYSVPRLMNYVSDVSWVYSDSPWNVAAMFRYHWEQEHPGEPWPLDDSTPTSQ